MWSIALEPIPIYPKGRHRHDRGPDIDGTIDSSPAATRFFSFLTGALRAGGHHVVILSHRFFLQELAVKNLEEWGITYDRLFWVQERGEKAKMCQQLQIDVLFDDTDECIAGVGAGTLVVKVQNEFNFDFAQCKWLGSAEFTSLDGVESTARCGALTEEG